MSYTIRLALIFFLAIFTNTRSQTSLSIIEEAIVIEDPLAGGTSGTRVGGSFNSEGYNPGIGSNHILYTVPMQIPNGYVEFEIKGFSASSMPIDEDHAFVILYDGRGISEPIPYYDDFKHNYFRWNVHWRENQSAFKAVICCADPTPERINSTLAIYEDKNGDGLDSHDRDWYTEPTGSGQTWNVNNWYKIKVEWNNKQFKVFVNGIVKWSVTGPNDYNPVDFKIWLGSGPDKYGSDMNLTYRNFKLVSYGTTTNYLSLSTDSLKLTSTSGNVNVDVSSNLSWNVSEELDWISISPTSGNGTGSFQVNYEENFLNVERSGVLQVVAGEFTKTIQIVQDGNVLQDYLIVDPSVDTVADISGTVNFMINSDLAWTIIDTLDWLSVSDTIGMGDKLIVINFDENTEGNPRTGDILIESSIGMKTYTITQNAKQIPGYLVVDPIVDTISHTSGSGSINIQSNMSWNINEDVVWLSKSPSTGSGDTTVIYNYALNPNLQSRMAELTISADTLVRIVRLLQLGTPLEVSVNSVPESGGTVQGTGTFYFGDTVKLVAVPNFGWSFVRFVESDTTYSLDSIITIELSADRYLQAEFEMLVGVNGNNSLAPNKFLLGNNFPNPFNPSTTFEYSIAKESYVRIDLYNVLGKHVKTLVDNVKSAGTYKYILDATNLTSGVYFYRMQASSFTETKQLIIMK